MIPKWKFALYSSFGVIGAFFIFSIAVFIFSLVLFVLSQYGFLSMSFFEFMGTMHALRAIPVTLLILTVLLLILIEVISRKYEFSFRRPLAITLLAITSFAVIVSFVISITPIHEYVRDYTRDHRGMKFMASVYDRPMPFGDRDGMTVIRGKVIDVSTSSIALRLFDGKVVRAHASSTYTKLPDIKNEDDIVLFGLFLGEVFEIVESRDAPPKPFGKGKRGERREMGMPMRN